MHNKSNNPNGWIFVIYSICFKDISYTSGTITWRLQGRGNGYFKWGVGGGGGGGRLKWEFLKVLFLH